MKTALLAFLAILPVLAVPVFADEVQFPVLTTDGLTGMDISTFYPSNQTYTVQIVLQYNVDHPLEIPPVLSWIDIAGERHTILLQDDFNLEHFPAPVPEVDTSAQDEEDRIDAILDAKKLEIAKTKDTGFSKLRTCLVEFKEKSDEEGNKRYEAWQRTASLQEFVIPDQQIIVDHPDVAEKNAIKKWQECEGMKSYAFLGVWTANKILDDESELGEPLDETRSYDDPVTAEDMRQAQIKAEAFQCSEEGKSRGLCKDYLAGEAYLIPKPQVPDWYNQYREQRAEPIDTQVAIDRAMLTQCETYYPLYTANDAVELPTWLGHCAP